MNAATDPFYCRRFLVYQGDSAMRISSDACFFGAFLAEHIEGRVLDLGCGSGILSFLIASNGKTNVTGIDIDRGSLDAATVSLSVCSFGEALAFLEGDVRNLHLETTRFDVVVCNPPFFETPNHTPHRSKRTAWHNGDSDLNDFFRTARTFISDEGSFYLLFPQLGLYRAIETGGKSGFHLAEQIIFESKSGAKRRRLILRFVSEKPAFGVATRTVERSTGVGNGPDYYDQLMSRHFFTSEELREHIPLSVLKDANTQPEVNAQQELIDFRLK